MGACLHVGADFAHHVHFAGLAVEAQGEAVFAVDQCQWLCFDGALHTRHAFGLFGAQAQAEAHAVFGDHEADVAGFFVGFVGGGDHFHAVFGVEIARFVVEHVGQVGEGVFGVGRGWLGLGGGGQAGAGLEACGFQRVHGFAAQGVEGGGGHKPGLAELHGHVQRLEHGVAQPGQLFFQFVGALGGVAGGCEGECGGRLGGVAVFVGQGEVELTRRGVGQRHPEADAAVGGFFVECAHPVHAAVAVDFSPLSQVFEAGDGVFGVHAPQLGGGALGGRGQGFYPVGLKADQFFLQVVVAQAVAVLQLGGGVGGFEFDEVFAVAQPVADLGDPANGLAGVFGAVECANVFLAALHEVVGEFAVEVLVWVGGEGVGAVPAGGGSQFGAALQNFVQQGAVVGGDVFHIAHVFVAAFDFEAAYACVDQRLHVGALVVVFHAQHVFVVRHEAASRVDHLVGQAAGLAAVAPVGAAPGVGVADEALAAVGHAQGAVHKEFQGCSLAVFSVLAVWAQGHVDAGDLCECQFAGQHQLAQAGVLQKAGFFGGADVGLGAGVQLNGRQVEFEQAHVLDDEGVYARVVQLAHELAGGLQLVVAQDGVERDENAAVEAVRVLDQPGNVLHGVVGAAARPETGAADVDGIGPVVDGFDADVGGAGGGEQFKLVGKHRGQAKSKKKQLSRRTRMNTTQPPPNTPMERPTAQVRSASGAARTTR